jgi:hypothetical protein
MSAIATKYRATLRTWLSGASVRAGLLALTVVCIVGLALLKATAVDAGPLASLLKLILPFAFVGLSIVDFRAAVAVAVFELVLAGAGGRWAYYGGGLSGRILLDGVVMLRAVSIVIAAWRRGDRSVLGRYGVHALALAFLFPAIWMPIGLFRHNGASNVFGDGNGFVFFAFAVVVITLVRGGYGAWFRNVFFAACATSGIVNLLLVVASTSHLITLKSVQDALIYRLDMGGIIGRMPDGAFRFFTGASLYLQVGLALSAWRLLARPRCYRYWLLFAVFWIDLGVTYTRGLWIGGAAAFALVVALGAPTLKRALTVSGVTVSGFAIAVLVASVAGFSFTGYVFKLAATITSSRAPSYPTAIVNPGFEKPGGWQPLDMGTRSLLARRTVSEHRSGSHSLELTNTASSEDDYAYEYLSVLPSTTYMVSAWVRSAGVVAPPAGDKGLFVWEPGDDLTFNAPIGPPESGWKRLAFSFTTGRLALKIQIRLYAPKGRVYWDDVNLGMAKSPAIVNPGFEKPGGWQSLDTGTRSLLARRTVSEHRSGSHSLELTNTASSEDDYAYEYLSVLPSTTYRVSAWVRSAGVVAPPAGDRGLFVWELQDDLTFNAPIGPPESGWKRLAFSFTTGRLALKIQIRLYAPKGRVYWDDVNLGIGTRRVGQPTPKLNIEPGDTAGQSGDLSGEISNGYRVVEAKSLFRHIRKHPLLGSGFGTIATDFAKGYRYELSYLDLLFKAGIVGLLLFLSFPLRLIWDALRLRFGRAEKSHERVLEGGSVVVAIVASVLLVGATNPYLFAAFGLFPILAAAAWLEPVPEPATESRKN